MKTQAHLEFPRRFEILGSGLNCETAGDIDINMDYNWYKVREVTPVLEDLLGSDNVKSRPGTNQIFSCVPVSGNPDNGHVQVDWMFGNPQWQRFSYHSPGLDSKFKGLFRTELIKAAVAFHSDYVGYDERGWMISRIGPTFFHDRGCVWRYRLRPIRKDGTGRVRQLEEVSQQEFLSQFPDAPKASRDLINIPEDVRDLLFTPDTPLAVFHSYETLIEALRAHHKPLDFHGIKQIFEERLNSLKVEIPREIQYEILAGVSRT